MLHRTSDERGIHEPLGLAQGFKTSTSSTYFLTSSLRNSCFGGCRFAIKFPFWFCPQFPRCPCPGWSPDPDAAGGWCRSPVHGVWAHAPHHQPETPPSLRLAGRNTKPSVLLDPLLWIGGTNDKHRKQEEKLSKRGSSFPEGKGFQALPFTSALLGWDWAFCWTTGHQLPPSLHSCQLSFSLPLHSIPSNSVTHSVCVWPWVMTSD